MKATDLPPGPDCGGQLTEHGPDNDSSRNAYDCPLCGWGLQDCDEPLTVASAPWTREVWAEVERLRAELARLERILAVERGDASAAPEGWEYLPYGWRGISRGWRKQWGSFAAWHLNGEWGWDFCVSGCYAEGTAPTALEAMEAADRAVKGEG